ncbi:MAG: DinB family protein [Planctomycetes bacterium]|nr:DinB family protein [Planctomycetota bacterium]
MTQEFEFQTEFAALRAIYAEIDELLARPADELRCVLPAVSGWSPEQQLAHLALANELVARNLRSLIKGAGMFVVDGGEPVPGALEVLATGAFPRGQAQAPRIVRPPEVVEREYLLEWLGASRAEFEALALLAPELRQTTKKVPHQVLGPLSASQWLRFASAHSRHHLAIACEILAARARAPANG